MGWCLVAVDGGQGLKHGLARDERLVQEAREAKHGEAAVLELLELEVGALGGVLPEFEGVKAEVARGAAICEHVIHGHLAVVEHKLHNAAEDDDLAKGACGRLHRRLDGVGAVVVRPPKAHKLLHNHAHNAEHANAAVLELSLAQPLQVHDVREVERVKAHVARHALAKLGGLDEERHGLRELRHAHCGARGHRRPGHGAGERSGSNNQGGEHCDRRSD
mmetsp:Transcript_27856/g.75052  ORF Transcript_27856/g.75052 Transcript_27856/m.75052 type:complete len:219 (-) Transcript_27856:15-671(-)